MAVDPGFHARLAQLIQDERRGMRGFVALLEREEPAGRTARLTHWLCLPKRRPRFTAPSSACPTTGW